MWWFFISLMEACSLICRISSCHVYTSGKWTAGTPKIAGLVPCFSLFQGGKISGSLSVFFWGGIKYGQWNIKMSMLELIGDQSSPGSHSLPKRSSRIWTCPCSQSIVRWPWAHETVALSPIAFLAIKKGNCGGRDGTLELTGVPIKNTLRKDGWNRMPHYYAKCLICLTLAVLRRFSKHLNIAYMNMYENHELQIQHSPFPIFHHGLQKTSPRMIQTSLSLRKGRIVKNASHITNIKTPNLTGSV